MGSRKVLDRFPPTEEGWASAWAALVKLDSGAAKAIREAIEQRAAAAAASAAQHERRVHLYDTFVRAGMVTTFRAFGVQTLAGDDNVYTIGSHDHMTKTNDSRLLGPLAGAKAMVTDGSQARSPGRAMFLPIGLAGLATKTKADAAVVFADGKAHTVALDGNNAVREAQKQVVQFNALAGACAPAATETGTDSAVKFAETQ